MYISSFSYMAKSSIVNLYLDKKPEKGLTTKKQQAIVKPLTKEYLN